MARPTLTPEDFIGWINISANSFKEDLLQQYIDLFYEQYTRAIIGDSAYLAIESEANQKWIDLMAGVSYIDSNGDQKVFDGLTASLLKFIYFEFIRDNFTSSQPGKVLPKSENSERLSGAGVAALARSRYNSAVLAVNSNTPPFLDALETISTPVLSVTDSYRIHVATTKYLNVGDTVEVNGLDHIVFSIVVNTSFVILTNPPPGETFSGDASWKPYDLINFKTQTVATI